MWQYKQHRMKRGSFLSEILVAPYHVIIVMVPVILQRTAHRKVETSDMMLQVQHSGLYVPQLSRKQARRIGLSTCLLPKSHMTEVLPKIAYMSMELGV